MPVGVPEGEVFAAADRVLARGERPTTERVRAELGRGSPARVGQLLEQWWDALSKRLAGESRLPDLPAEVAAAFKTVWASASAHGRQDAEAALAAQKAQVAADRAALEAEHLQTKAEIEIAEALVREADRSRDAAHARLDDLRRLLDQQTEQSADVLRQRDQLQLRSEQLELELATWMVRLQTQESTAMAEREALTAHVRAVEERTHSEVDRAREEAKGLRTQIAQIERELRSADQTAATKLEAATTHARAAEREAAVQVARAQTLEREVARMDGVPAALLAAQQALQVAHDREAALHAELALLRQNRPTKERSPKRVTKRPTSEPSEATTARIAKRPAQ